MPLSWAPRFQILGYNSLNIHNFWAKSTTHFGMLRTTYVGNSLPLYPPLDFWLILLLAPVVTLAVDLAFEGFRRRFIPYDYQIIHDMEQSRSNDVVSEMNNDLSRRD